MDDEALSWRVIAVLHSTVFLPPALSVRLYLTAVRLQRDSVDLEKISDEHAMGTVRRLGRDVLLGTIGGPAFEAELETPRGKGFVRFIVTREGVEMAEHHLERERQRQKQQWN